MDTPIQLPQGSVCETPQNTVRVWQEPLAIWKRHWPLIADHFNNGTYDLLWRAYNHPDRTHTNLHRVASMLEGMATYINTPDMTLSRQDRKDIVAAIFFKSSVYHVHSPDNEEQSTRFFMRCLRIGPESKALRSAVPGMIRRATHHDAQGATDAEAFFLDLDLRMYGADMRTYAVHATRIRDEHTGTHPHDYQAMRIDYLRELLSRERMFHTPVVRDAYEEQAQRNITWEISRLSNPRMGVNPAETFRL